MKFRPLLTIALPCLFTGMWVGKLRPPPSQVVIHALPPATASSVARVSEVEETVDWAAVIAKLKQKQFHHPDFTCRVLARLSPQVPWELLLQELTQETQQLLVLQAWAKVDRSAAWAFYEAGKFPAAWANELPRSTEQALAALAAAPISTDKDKIVQSHVRDLAKSDPKAAYDFSKANGGFALQEVFLSWAQRDYPTALAAWRTDAGEAAKLGMAEFYAQLPAAEATKLAKGLTEAEFGLLSLPSANMIQGDFAYWAPKVTDGTCDLLSAWAMKFPDNAWAIYKDLPFETQLGVLERRVVAGKLSWREMAQLKPSMAPERLTQMLDRVGEAVDGMDPKETQDFVKLYPPEAQVAKFKTRLEEMAILKPEAVSEMITSETDPEVRQRMQAGLINSMVNGGVWGSPHDNMVQLSKTPDANLRATLFGHMIARNPESRQHYASWMNSSLGASLDLDLVRAAVAKVRTEMDPKSDKTLPPGAEVEALNWLQQWQN
jgi:hypothetical protein